MARSGDSSPPIRAKLQSGVLPREPFVKTWRGPGTGKPCDVCEVPITPIEHFASTSIGRNPKSQERTMLRAGATERILRALHELHDPRRLFVRVRLLTLAEMTGLSRPAIRKALAALVDRGLVSKAGYDAYRLGPKTT